MNTHVRQPLKVLNLPRNPPQYLKFPQSPSLVKLVIGYALAFEVIFFFLKHNSSLYLKQNHSLMQVKINRKPNWRLVHQIVMVVSEFGLADEFFSLYFSWICYFLRSGFL